MHGIEIAEHDHNVVITVNTDVIERWRIDQALSFLDVPDVGFASAEEQTELDGILDLLTEEDRQTVFSERVHFDA